MVLKFYENCYVYFLKTNFKFHLTSETKCKKSTGGKATGKEGNRYGERI